MTWRKREIMEMAEEAGLTIEPPSWGYIEDYDFAGFKEDMERFVALVRADEREACAKVCEGFVMGSPYAAAIRARGQT